MAHGESGRSDGACGIYLMCVMGNLVGTHVVR